LILGASARAAAFSALRGGLHPWCADYFADGDLAALCPVERVDPQFAESEFIRLSESVPPAPWFYAGGFENRPELVERIANRHQLWGADASALRAVRDPVRVAKALSEAGIPCPAVRLSPRSLPRDGSWLVKPLASGAGRGIAPLLAHGGNETPEHYYQKRIDGPSFSALFIGSGRRARLIGVTRQLIGVTGSPFGYRGSIGPCRTLAPLVAQLQRLGEVLTASFGLLGWFGVDYVRSAGIPWPVEVNPRYTASIEIHELSSRWSLLGDHRRACEDRELSNEPALARSGCRRSTVGKLILHARRRLIVGEIAPAHKSAEGLFSVRSIADIPVPGSRFEAGEPVLTLLAEEASAARCRRRLFRLERGWRRRLEAGASDPAPEAF
jgi:predicted ATP-grasp superfamily ATP-dependent carboligase